MAASDRVSAQKPAVDFQTVRYSEREISLSAMTCIERCKNRPAGEFSAVMTTNIRFGAGTHPGDRRETGALLFPALPQHRPYTAYAHALMGANPDAE